MTRLRARGLDVALCLLAAAEAVSVLQTNGPHRSVVAVLAALSALVLLARRWQPLAACVAAFALEAVQTSLMPHSTVLQFFGLLFTFAVAGAIHRQREAVVAWAAGAGNLAWSIWITDPAGSRLGDFALSLAFATTMWAAGMLVARRGRDARASAARAERAELAEQERRKQAQRALAEERARIARELHDVVSHGLSVVVLQTLAARAALHDAAPTDEIDRHLDAAEETAREALGEMRRMLGLLQAEHLTADPVVAAPAPGLSALPQLVERAAGAGVRVVSVELPAGVELASGLGLAVHRIVQESLTNAVKHAPGAGVSVSVRVHDQRVEIAVTNDAGGSPAKGLPGAGLGITGMRQRAELYGGTLTAEPRADGGFRVLAVLPLDDAVLPTVPA